MALSVLQKIQIGAYSEALSAIDILKSGLYGGGIDLQLPRKLYCIRKTIEWAYNLNNNDTTLTSTSNYLIALCGKYYLKAAASITGSGGTVSPISPSEKTYLIPITGYDFTDATNYNNPVIVGKNLAIFWNDISRYLFSTEYTLTATGFNVLAAGFDAVANPSYELFIYIINP